MANIFSDILTDVNNNVIIDAGEVAGNLLVSTSVVDLQSQPAVTDVIMYCDLPSNAKIKQIVFYNDDLDSSDNVTISAGIYAGEKFTLSNGDVFLENDVIDVSTFALSDDMFQNSSNLGEDFRFNPSNLAFINLGGFSNAQLALWELAGSGNLIEDPFKSLRIGVLIIAPFGTFVPGKSLLQVYYTGKT